MLDQLSLNQSAVNLLSKQQPLSQLSGEGIVYFNVLQTLFRL